MKLHYLLFAALLALTSCNDEDSPGITPNSAVTKAFNDKYPDASRIEWEYKHNYLTAEFFSKGYSATAWFNQNGEWYMTKTELTRKDQLPEAVQTAFDNSSYAQWMIDDIDCLERAEAETLYIIEVKKDRQEYELYYTSDGILVKELPDDENDDYENYLPGNTTDLAVLQEFIENKYPGARIVETETEHNRIEVDIIHDNRSKEVVFTLKQEWVNTHYDVKESEVNSIVLEALAGSAYSNYYKDEIEKYETPSGEYYFFELEKGEQEVKITIDLQGQLQVI